MFEMSVGTMAKRLYVSEDRAREIIRAFLGRYTDATKWRHMMHVEVERNKQVRSLYGRIRHLPDIDSDDPAKQGEAKRQATNFVIQDATCETLYAAMIRIDKRIKEENIPAYLLLNVHDSIVLEVKESDVDRMVGIIREEMVDHRPDVIQFSRSGKVVPLEVDIKVGPNWGSMKKVGGIPSRV
jgi:DNA polymerase-1